MNVLLISDTHGKTDKVEAILAYYKDISAIIHCGDHIGDARVLEKHHPEVTIYKVPGNCDLEGTGSGTTLFAEIGGVPIFMAHGHKHHVKYTDEELVIDGEAHEAKVVVYGHTHLAKKIKKEGLWIINPGSITSPRDTTYGSFALMKIQSGEIKSILFYLYINQNQMMLHPDIR